MVVAVRSSSSSSSSIGIKCTTGRITYILCSDGTPQSLSTIPHFNTVSMHRSHLTPSLQKSVLLMLRFPLSPRDVPVLQKDQTLPWAHTSSYWMGIGGSFPPAVKRSGRVADHYLPSGPDIKKACSCTSFPPIFHHNMHCDMSPTSIGDLLGSTIRRFGREALTGLFFYACV